LHTQFDGDFESALAKLKEAVTVAEEIDGRGLRVEGHLRTAFVLFNLGDLAGCKQELERCIELAAELGSRRDETRALYLLGLVEHYSGELAEAERLGLQARDSLERTGETYFQIQNLVALANYALARDDLVGAERRLQEAIPIALEEGGWLVAEIYRYLTETLVRQGRADEAARIAEFAARDVREEDLYAQAHVRLAAALAATGAGRRDEAVSAYKEARELFDRQNMPIPAGETSIVLARALEAFDDAEASAAELGRARETFARVGATRVIGEIDRRLAELRSGAGTAGPARSN
jgi:tetratricopeptide (TPR) repeat protein